MNKFIKLWIPPIIMMCVIFYFSSRQNVSVSSEFTINFIILKTLHTIGYALLHLLLFRAVYVQEKKKNLDISLKKAAIIAILYAATDELHQQFVPTREGKIRDVIIDAVGISIMYIYIKHNFNRIKQFLME